MYPFLVLENFIIESLGLLTKSRVEKSTLPIFHASAENFLKNMMISNSSKSATANRHS